MFYFLLSEYNVNAPPLLNEKVLKDKRKKLKETWDRVMRLYVRSNSYNFFFNLTYCFIIFCNISLHL